MIWGAILGTLVALICAPAICWLVVKIMFAMFYVSTPGSGKRG